jgi:pimeloyl-ACP methyl ester carboxylesterase
LAEVSIQDKKLSGAESSPAGAEVLRVRLHGDPSLPCLIYLPGLHGDWTLIGRFRRALGGRVRFVEITYPRTLDWSLEDHARVIEEKLLSEGITKGWLLGESFGSQIVWPFLARRNFKPEGVILAGGFVRHPVIWGVKMAESFARGVSLTLLTQILFGYARLARARYRGDPEVMQEVQEFIARRTELDRKAAAHRLRLLSKSNFCEIARHLQLPVYALTGAFDPIVPWFPVRGWLKKNCSTLQEYRVIWRSDHNVLGNASHAAAKQVLQWMGISRHD